MASIGGSVVKHMIQNTKNVITGNNFEVTYSKTMPSNGSRSMNAANGTFNLPSDCNMIVQNYPNFNCSKEIIYHEVRAWSAALPGKRSTETSNIPTNASSSLGLKIHADGYNELKISNLSVSIGIWIARNSSQDGNAYTFMNATSLNANAYLQNDFYAQSFVSMSFNKTIINSLFSIVLKPKNVSIGYMIILKFGSRPNLKNELQYDLDKWTMFCPREIHYNPEKMESYYKFFLNSNSSRPTYTGNVSYSIREMTPVELNLYCQANLTYKKLTKAPLLNSFSYRNEGSNVNVDDNDNGDYISVYFHSDFWVKVNLFACTYYDTQLKIWSTKGVEVLPDSNETLTHCLTNHLTEFAGGYIVLPASIDFNAAFSNASFTRNLTIYITLITITSLYVLMAIYSAFMDRRDSKKVTFTLLVGNNWLFNTENYFYELIVFTGIK